MCKLNKRFNQIALEKNSFTGSIDLEILPENMEELSVYHRQLTGSLKLGSLPETLKTLFCNEFSGSVDLTELPMSLIFPDLTENQLDGPVALTQFPEKLEQLGLTCEQFSVLKQAVQWICRPDKIAVKDDLFVSQQKLLFWYS
ncbi:hypothetical protein XU18_2667 [Perkinsela sp. CCAP 1560/4]|nr:hypothetical protein XU18_4659 [Perkinsela sp. CCAP 1560/4]KNH06463.1 hypothetical protein XU18_2667 [Perkinsela sp. CCAP 1560/4]|eukprot:KNH03989.1 hypothetical protein XU18_4659 [Perkinsela sp. CCAP 1560/4]